MAIEFNTDVGSVDSTSYITDAEFLQYWENQNATIYATLNALSSDVRKQYCNTGTSYIDSEFVWKDGERANPNGTTAALKQALDWGRTNATDDQGDDIDSTIIPKAIKDATCEAAYRAHLQGIAGLTPDRGRATKREKLNGVGEIEYFNNKNLSDNQYIKIHDLLYGYIASKRAIVLQLA